MFCFCYKDPFEVLFLLPPQNSASNSTKKSRNNFVTERALEYVLSGKRSKDWKTKSGASSVSRSGTLEETLCL